MKNKYPRSVFAVLTALVLITASVQASTSLVFSTGAPENAPIPNLASRLLKEAFNRNQIYFDSEHHPSSRSLDLSNSGQLDGELFRVHNLHKATGGAYPNLLRVEFVIAQIQFTAFSKSGLNITGWDDIRDLDVGFLRGQVWTTKRPKKLDMKGETYPVTSVVQAFRMLADDRIDVVIAMNNIGEYIIKNSTQFAAIDESVIMDELKLYPYLHKDHADLMPALISSLNEMESDGTIEEITESLKGE